MSYAPISPKDLAELRALASSASAAEQFCVLAKMLLLKDFDYVFEFLKVQKLITKNRDLSAVRSVKKRLQEWLESAPISGKRKARLRRHLEVSARMQELFCEIDLGAKELGIWQCGRRELALTVLDAVEQCYDLCVTEGRERKWEGLDLLETLDSSRSLTSTLRNFCDVSLTILAQVALRCPEKGIPFDHTEDLKRAIELAMRYDELSVVFDHYTYTRWRALVSESDIRFHPAFDDYDRARQWCAQRTEASDSQFRNAVTLEYARIEEQAKKRATAERPHNQFDEFLQSELGLTIRAETRPLRDLVLRFMSERVSGVFDPESDMQTSFGTFRIKELLSGWSAIWLLSICARIWNSARIVNGTFQGGDSGRVPILNLGFLEKFLRQELDFNEQTATNFRRQFTAELDDRSSLDLFYRPLLRLSDKECALAISYAETSRFDRNLFRIALRDSDLDVSKRGFKPLSELVSKLRTKKFKALTNVPLYSQGSVQTDADLLFYSDGSVFVAQVKIVIEADSIYETWQVEQKLRTAAGQLSRTLSLLRDTENLHPIACDLGVSLPSAIKEVVPFILTNDWHFTGTRIERFSVIDLSYLDLITTRGAITVGTRERPVTLKLIRGDMPTSEELKMLILEPFHRGMFTRPDVHYLTQKVGKLSFSIPVTDVANAPDTH
jgi:hypothetical protein